MPCCSAYNCSNNSSKQGDGKKISLHTFPDQKHDKKRHGIWVKMVNRKGWLPTVHSRLCSEHFTNDDFHHPPNVYTSLAIRPTSLSLKNTAVPTIFKKENGTSSRKHQKSKAFDKKRNMEMRMAVPTLYSAWFCPFAQRPWLAFTYKGVPYNYTEQDPYVKSPEWLAINPRGLVPAIKHRDFLIVESNICVEYIDEAFPQEPFILPRDPLQRAEARMWGKFIDQKIVPNFYALVRKKTEEEYATAKSNLIDALRELTNAKSKKGDFFMGPEFGFVDIMILPFFVRLPLINEFRDFTFPDEPIFDEMQKWKHAMFELECVKPTLPDLKDLIERYRNLLFNKE